MELRHPSHQARPFTEAGGQSHYCMDLFTPLSVLLFYKEISDFGYFTYVSHSHLL